MLEEHQENKQEIVDLPLLRRVRLLFSNRRFLREFYRVGWITTMLVPPPALFQPGTLDADFLDSRLGFCHGVELAMGKLAFSPPESHSRRQRHRQIDILEHRHSANDPRTFPKPLIRADGVAAASHKIHRMGLAVLTPAVIWRCLIATSQQPCCFRL